ncbi:MAG: prenyltransferase/squalene oxidase repeat-containing protein [Bacteroidota bacterium]
MKFLERFSINIYSYLALGGLFGRRRRRLLRKMEKAGSLRQVLRRGVSLLNDETREQLRSWVVAQQTKEGGFPDRAGRCDLYYTLFGLFLAEALETGEVFPALKEYAAETARAQGHHGIDLFCMAILHGSLFPDERVNKQFAGAIRRIMNESRMLQTGYTSFLVILSLLSVHDYAGAALALKSMGKYTSGADKPCTVVAAQQMVAYLKSGNKGVIMENKASGAAAFTGPFSPFYRENGGFAALAHTREPDLLSTATALFVLRFMDCDLRMIRPDCLDYITGLYRDGGFAAVNPDNDTDVEYTFYGLLALGALNSQDEQN